MRISYLLAGFGYTGGNIVLYNFMDKLCERGNEVFAVTPHETICWNQEFSKRIISEKVLGLSSRLKEKAINLGKPLTRKIKLLDRLGRMTFRIPPSEVERKLEWLTKHLIKNCPKTDIVIATHNQTAFAAYLIMDSAVPFYHIQHYEELFSQDSLSRKLTRLTYYIPLVLIANSKWLENQIKIRFDRACYLLNPGIDTCFYPRYNINTKYKNMDVVRIVSYYSPVRFKAWDEAVEAMDMVFRKLGQKRIEWLVFGGNPPVKPSVRCRFVGKIFGPTLAELYSSAHIIFMNSWYESFPLPPLEGMACGTAVITTRIGTEDYAFNGVNSIVIPPKEPALLAEAIIKLAEDATLAKQLAEAGVETGKKFSWDNAIGRLESILHMGIDNSPHKKFEDIMDLL